MTNVQASGRCTPPNAPRTLRSSRFYTRRTREQTTLATLCAPPEEQRLPTSLRHLSLASGGPCPPTRRPAPRSGPEAREARGEGRPGKPGPAGGPEDPGFHSLGRRRPSVGEGALTFPLRAGPGDAGLAGPEQIRAETLGGERGKWGGARGPAGRWGRGSSRAQGNPRRPAGRASAYQRERNRSRLTHPAGPRKPRRSAGSEKAPSFPFRPRCPSGFPDHGKDRWGVGVGGQKGEAPTRSLFQRL